MWETGGPVQERKERSSLDDGTGRAQEESSVADLGITQFRREPERKPGKNGSRWWIDRIFDMFEHTERFRQVRESLDDLGISIISILCLYLDI